MDDKMAAYLGFKAPTAEAPAPEPVKAEITSEPGGENTPEPTVEEVVADAEPPKKGRKKK